MALQKTIELVNGASGNYIRISEANIVNGSQDCNLKIQVWKDQATRESSNKVPLEERSVQVTMSGEGDIFSKCYNGLKDISDFSGSVDV